MLKEKIIFFYCVMMLFSSVNGFSQGISLNSGKDFANACGINLPFSDKDHKIYLAKNGDFVIDNDNEGYSYREIFALPINEVEDYTIESTVQILKRKDHGPLGIVIGFKDWDNYTAFLVRINPYPFATEFALISCINGITIKHIDWTHNWCVNLQKKYNRLTVWKTGGKFILAINGEHVATVDAFDLLGDRFGFYIGDEGKYALKNFKIVSSEVSNSAVSTISNDQMKIVGSGTGFAIDNRGYFVTNYHVIDGAGGIGICIQKDGEWVSYIGKVIKTDPTNDIAIIKIDDEDFKDFNNIPYSFSYEAEDVAADIFTLGYPRVDVMGTDVKYTTGVINSRTGFHGDPTHYQISAHIDHGNSGGPLFNAKGQIIGITDSGLDKAEFGDVNYSVKSMYIKALVESLPVKLQLPDDTSIINMSRSEQIKSISPYVALILVAQ